MSAELPRGAVALFNGGPAGPELAFSRGLHYGDGVFRTLLRHDGRWLDFDRHYLKLVQDCRALGLEPPHHGQLHAELENLGGGRGAPQVGKVLLVRRHGGANARGYAPATHACDRLLLRYPAPQFAAANYREGIAAILSPVRLGAQPRLAGVKHLSRLENVLASRDWPAQVHEALMCSEDSGALVCGSRSNLFWVRDGRLHTPVLDRCGVAGVLRAKVFDLARELGLPAPLVVAEPPSALLAAEEAFVCNSLFGIWPLRALDGAPLPAAGPVTRALVQALDHPALVAGGPTSGAMAAAPREQLELIAPGAVGGAKGLV